MHCLDSVRGRSCPSGGRGGPGSLAFSKSKSKLVDETIGLAMLIPQARLGGEIITAHLEGAGQASMHPEPWAP